MPLKQLARATDLPKPTVHRLLHTLQTLGYVTRDGDSTDYLLGHRIQELAGGPIQQRIKDAALPLMHRLHKAVNETVNLGVREGFLIRYVDYLETTRPLRLAVQPGQTDSIFSTALGRAILSVLPETEVRRILAAAQRENGFLPEGGATKLETLLALGRKRGWAEEEEETVKGICCIAVSLERLGFPHAAVSVAVPSVRYNGECRRAIQQIFQQFHDAA